MKRNQLLTTAMALVCFGASAQVSVYLEDFQGVPTTTWVNNDLNTASSSAFSHVDSAWVVYSEWWYLFANAAASQGNNQVAVSTSKYIPAGTSDDWLLTPLISIPNNCYFRWSTRSYRNTVSSLKPNAYEVRVSNTGTNTADYTDMLYSIPAESYETRHRYVDLSAYGGQTISVGIVNNTYNGYYIGMDDLEIIELMDYDMSGIEVSTKVGVKQNVLQDITGTLRNYGNLAVTSMDMNYRVNGGSVITQNLTSLNIAPMDYYDFTHPTQWTPASVGSALVEVWASNINGNADMLLTNDTASKTIEVYQDMTIRRPLYEDFSSADCGPCKSWNNFIHPHLADSWKADVPYPDGHISAIYYQMDYPGNPDPSFNDHSDTRHSYYNVSGIPRDFLDGSVTLLLDNLFDVDWNQPATWDEFTYNEIPAFIDMDVEVSKTGFTDINVTVDVTPLKDFTSSNLKLHIVVCEWAYDYFGGQNGETEFFYVMRRMMPDAGGNSIGPLTQSNTIQVSESYSFTTGNVSAGSYNLWNGIFNTTVVAFVQDNVTKEVHQSAVSNNWPTLVEELMKDLDYLMYPVPAVDELNIDFNRMLEEDMRVEIISLNGQTVHSGTYNGTDKLLLDVGGLASGMYIVNMNSNNFHRTQKIMKQ